MISINGSEKSGSGTILRYALALAAILGEDVRIDRIRAKRDKPGLRPQHLAAVKACAEMCDARVQGAHVGSSELMFRPGARIRGGEYRWDIGTAGSTTMLALALLPLAVFADAETSFVVTGGVFQDFAPSPFHMQKVLFETLRKMAIDADLQITRPGYVPSGNGEILVKVKPIRSPISALSIAVQGKAEECKGVAIASRLESQHVSERMANECRRVLSAHRLASSFDITNDESASQPGAALAVWTETTSGCLLGADQAGQRGRSSESIGVLVANNLIADLASGATVDRFLSDQLVIFAALAEGISEYRIPSLTDHVDSNLWLVEEFGARTRLEHQRLLIEGLGVIPPHSLDTGGPGRIV